MISKYISQRNSGKITVKLRQIYGLLPTPCSCLMISFCYRIMAYADASGSLGKKKCFFQNGNTKIDISRHNLM